MLGDIVLCYVRDTQSGLLKKKIKTGKHKLFFIAFLKELGYTRQ